MLKVDVYKDGDQYVWIPVASESRKFPARAFLPFKGVEEVYRHGYKAGITESKYLVALSDIQNSFLNNESKVFTLNNGKDERQYKAKWRHGMQPNAPLLGPTKGWVKVELKVISEICVTDLAAAIEASGNKYCELNSSSIGPVLCNSNTELEEQIEKLRMEIGNRIPDGQKVPHTYTSSHVNFVRDATVVAYVLKQANGVCECCDGDAPFIKGNGEAFLEVHHVKHLAEGGSDTIQNAVAICPNCHRELHYGADRCLLIGELYTKIRRLNRE